MIRSIDRLETALITAGASPHHCLPPAWHNTIIGKTLSLSHAWHAFSQLQAPRSSKVPDHCISYVLALAWQIHLLVDRLLDEH